MFSLSFVCTHIILSLFHCCHILFLVSKGSHLNTKSSASFKWPTLQSSALALFLLRLPSASIFFDSSTLWFCFQCCHFLKWKVVRVNSSRSEKGEGVESKVDWSYRSNRRPSLPTTQLDHCTLIFKLNDLLRPIHSKKSNNDTFIHSQKSKELERDIGPLLCSILSSNVQVQVKDRSLPSQSRIL